MLNAIKGIAFFKKVTYGLEICTRSQMIRLKLVVNLEIDLLKILELEILTLSAIKGMEWTKKQLFLLLEHTSLPFSSFSCTLKFKTNRCWRSYRNFRRFLFYFYFTSHFQHAWSKFLQELYLCMTRTKHIKNDVIGNVLRALAGHEAANHSSVHKFMRCVIRWQVQRAGSSANRHLISHQFQELSE